MSSPDDSSPPADTVILVPARLASQRFPRKLLHAIDGRPHILWTAGRLRSELPGWPVCFAVAEEELETVLREAGYDTVRTDPGLPSGTDRLAAANRELGAAFVINVQADEPLVTAAEVQRLARRVRQAVDMATLATPFRSEADFQDPNRVKVVCDGEGRALYFSRAPIPCSRSAAGLGGGAALWHLGMYAYRREALEHFAGLAPSRLEQIEQLEQLRALEHGMRIGVEVVPEGGIGIDVPADVARFRAAAGLPPA